MTQTQFVEFRARGFWAYDVSLAIFLKHLIDAATARELATMPWLAEAVDWWRVVACVSDYGLTIDASWSPSQVAAFLEIADQACRAIERRDIIPPEEIASWQIMDGQSIFLRGATEIRTAPIAELGRAVHALVSRSLPDAPPGTWWFYGTPDGRTTLGMLEPP